MTSPAELLERALTAHGATLYRLALLLAGDEAGAGALLRAATAERVAVWRESPPAAPPGERELLTALADAARVAEAQRAAGRPGKPGRGAQLVAFGPFALQRLPFEQRLALGLFLLASYDGDRIAQVSGVEPAAARATLTEAVRALGPAAGHALSDRVSGELCLPVRESLADPSSGARHGAAVRGHLATCSLCRSFDHAWGEIVRAVEEQLRATLRERTLPPPLAERLVAAATPRRRRVSPSLRLALPPLAVLALIAALVLPGFLRAPVSVVQREGLPPRDPQELLALAVERQTTPPDRGGVWYGRYETQWFFDTNVYAPLTAESWLDPRNPARHRLQLTHADGGAPYELQLANGRDRLYYALDSAYAPALYGNLRTRARPEEPALANMQLNPEAQLRARDERLATGPWTIAPSYLRQAQAASDLRVLGRQRDGDRTVQILSFSGVSPLGLPPDAPGATAERVTVLLALDLEDGLLRSATELAGPAGAEQVSRVTWRLVEELWLGTGQQIEAAFDINRAWTGVGDFGERGRDESSSLALPLISARVVSDPARLLAQGFPPLVMPATPPPGVERALLLWPVEDSGGGNPMRGVIYLGPGRRLIMVYNTFTPVSGEVLETGGWRVTVEAAPTQRYNLALGRDRDASTFANNGALNPSDNILIDAFGFTRAELVTIIESMRPLDLASLAAQDALFSHQHGDAEARARLLRAAIADAIPPSAQAIYLRTSEYARRDEIDDDPRQDPYRVSLAELSPATVTVEEWLAGGATPTRYQATRSLDGRPLMQFYLRGDDAWMHQAVLGAAYRYNGSYAPMSVRVPATSAAALELIAMAGADLASQPLPDGAIRYSYSRDAGSQGYGDDLRSSDPFGGIFLEDLLPMRFLTELDVTAANQVSARRVYVLGADGRQTLVRSQEVVERAALPLADAPAELREGAVPDAVYTADYRGYGADELSSTQFLVTRQLNELGDELQGVYLLDSMDLLFVESGSPELQYVGNGEFLDPAIGQGLAQRFTYTIPPGPDGASIGTLRITQGPAGPLAAYLRAVGGMPWTSSSPIALTIDGREREAWIGSGGSGYLVVELDDTLLIAEAPQPWLSQTGLGLLATLRPAGDP